nr:relaxase/mobilization nuclease domain-containing protein [Staphylococcus hominis]
MVIQSFKSGEVTPAQCNQLGMELAEKIAPNHQDKKKLVFNSFQNKDKGDNYESI